MTVFCQNLALGALSSRSAPSLLVGALYKKFGLFLNSGDSGKCDKRTARPSEIVLSRKRSNNGRNVGNGVSPVEGTTLKGTVLKML
jgi:hypothetical protein